MKAKKNNTEPNISKRAKPKIHIVDNYENIKVSYRYLDRADRAGKLNSIEKQVLDLCLQLTAKTGWYVIDYDYLQDKIDRSRETVKRILETNSNLIKWRFERSLKVNGRKSYNVIVLERTEQVEKLLSESLQKLKEHRTKMYGVQHKNVRSSAQKCVELYIDNKEEIEDSPLRAISSISDTEAKTDEQIAAIKPPTSGLLVLEAASHPLRIKGKKQKRVSAKIIQMTALSEKEIDRKRQQRTTDKPENEQGFTLIAGIFKDIKLLQAPLDRSIELNIAQPVLGQGAETKENDQVTNENNKMQIPLKHTISKTWKDIRDEALANLEHEVDRWNLKFNFNELEVIEDKANFEIELKGAKLIIREIRKNYFKIFSDSFYKIAPNYTFKFSEVIK